MTDDAPQTFSGPPAPPPILPGMSVATGPPAAPPVQALSWRTLTEIVDMQFSEADWIVGDRFFCRGSNGVIVGPPGCGKSRMILQLAAACGLGWPFIGLNTNGKGLRWLLIQAENSNRRLADDARRICAWARGGWPDIRDNIICHTLEQDWDAYLTLSNQQNRELLAALVAKVQPDVVAWDCLQSFAVGDLNSDQAMFDTLSLISRITRQGNPSRMVLLLHHARVGRAGAASATGYDKGSYGRGSKALLGWARAVLNVAPGNEDASHLVFDCGKVSDGKAFGAFGAILNRETMIYEVNPEFDVAKWRISLKSKVQGLDNDEIALMAGPNGKLKDELAKMIRERCGIRLPKAREWIARALGAGLLREVEGTDTLCQSFKE